MVEVEVQFPGMNRVLRLSIEGMHCGGCVTRLTNTLKKIDGVEVRAAEVGAAEVAYDEQRVSKEDIAAAVEKIGFSVVGTAE
ncbi:MAG: hypothetical protein KatS3mg004_0844 [Bryobacteraceae bacterium]|nr:MAG: hypothetical protein KatS3mg004_0844 [Bryobacteraceae bacterium]